MGVDKKQRREQILKKASSVFAEIGFRRTDLQEIADQLGIGKGTIYRNFSSKEELFLSAVHYGIERLQQNMRETLSTNDSPTQVMTVGLKAYLAFFDKNPEVAELLIQERAEFKQKEKPTYFEFLEDNISTWENYFDALLPSGEEKRLSGKSITNILSNLVYGTMFTNLFRGRQQTLDEEIQDLLTFILSSLSSLFGESGNDASNRMDSDQEEVEGSSSINPPYLLGEPDWEPLSPPSIGKGRSFVSGEPMGDRIRVRYFQREASPKFVGKVWFGPGAEGPPSHAHGGSIASVLDEAMGAAAWMNGHIVVAAKLEIDYKQMLPLETVVFLESWVDSVNERKVVTQSRLFLEDGTVFAHGTGLFISVDTEIFGDAISSVPVPTLTSKGKGAK